MTYAERLEAAFDGEAVRLNMMESAPAYERPEGPLTGAGDPLYADAIALVRKHNKASISLVQRHLKTSYSRAASMLEAMEGSVITAHKPSEFVRSVIK